MASYHDSYDSRPRTYEPPRSRSAVDSYLRPEAALGSSLHSSDKRSRSRSRARSPDSRKSYPPLLTPDLVSSHRSRSHSRRRSSWPPAPICEDEAASLAKEAGSQKLLKDIGKDEAVLRGTVDQEPIVQDISQPTMAEESKVPSTKHSRTPSSYSFVPTPPTSDDEKVRTDIRRPTKLNMSFDDIRNDVPELAKRTSSPYSFSKDTGLAKEEKAKARAVSSEKFMSPPPTDPSSRFWKGAAPRSPGTPKPDPSNRTPNAKSGGDYFSLSSGESAIDDTDGDTSDAASQYSRRKPATYPAAAQAKGEQPKTSAQSDVVDFAPSSGLAPPRRRNLDARRNTDIGSGSTQPDLLPKLNMDKTRRPTPLMTTTSALGDSGNPALFASPVATHAALDVPSFTSRNPSTPSSRNVSPSNLSTGKQRNSTPPETPRTSAEFIRDVSAENSPSVSRNSSVSNSRPSSPSPRTPLDASRFPKTDLDWSALLAANTARRSKPAPRIAALRQETMPMVSRDDNGQMPINSPIPPVSRSSSLPYPVDDGPSTPTVWMPAEQPYQYYPDPKPTVPYAPVVQEPKAMPRTSSPTVGSLPPGYGYSSRPSTSRQSTLDMPRPEKYSQPEKPRTIDSPRHEPPRQEPQPQPEKPRITETKRISSFNNASQAKKDLPTLMKKGLPDCSRTKPLAGYNDWYCLTSTPSLDFCPDCIDHIDRTAFRLSFRRSPPRSSDKKVICALGGLPWIRLAWLLTLQRKLTNLELLERIARVEDSTEPCPGDQPCIRPWYGIRDRDGHFIRDFGICYNDVKKIESLFPTLNNLFVPLPRRASLERGICAIRPDTNRFSDYLDSLIGAHEAAISTRRPADPTPFTDLVKRRQRLRECSRDALFQNYMWHFHPDIPHLTVCEDCFESVVEPQISRKNSLASQFNRTVQPAYFSEGLGVSCQLYSPRMRRVFARAMSENDFNYLARKAKGRREAEVRLQERFQGLAGKVERAKREGAGEEEWARLERERKRIGDEWAQYE